VSIREHRKYVSKCSSEYIFVHRFVILTNPNVLFEFYEIFNHVDLTLKEASEGRAALCFCCMTLLQVSPFTKWANIFSPVLFQQRFDIVLALFWFHNFTTSRVSGSEHQCCNLR